MATIGRSLRRKSLSVFGDLRSQLPENRSCHLQRAVLCSDGPARGRLSLPVAPASRCDMNLKLENSLLKNPLLWRGGAKRRRSRSAGVAEGATKPLKIESRLTNCACRSTAENARGARVPPGGAGAPAHAFL